MAGQQATIGKRRSLPDLGRVCNARDPFALVKPETEVTWSEGAGAGGFVECKAGGVALRIVEH